MGYNFKVEPIFKKFYLSDDSLSSDEFFLLVHQLKVPFIPSIKLINISQKKY